MQQPDIQDIYTRYKKLKKKQRSEIISALQHLGYAIKDIQPYEYPESKTIKHLFFYFEDVKEPIPYFQVEPSLFETFVSLLPDIPEK